MLLFYTMSNMRADKILVVKNRAMGDAILSLGAVQYMRELFPAAQIDYAVPDWVAPLFDSMETAADKVIPFRLNSVQDWGKMWQLMRKNNYDIVYECFLAGRSFRFFRMYSLLHRTRYLYHDHHNRRRTGIYDQGVIKSYIQRDLEGIWSQMAPERPRPDYLHFGPKMKTAIEASARKIILGVVATRQTKMWPLEYYAKIIDLIAEHCPQVQIVIPLSQSETDQNIRGQLNQNLRNPGQVHFLQVPLSELAKNIAGATLYLGNDTGLKHLAIALGIKSFSFFGPEPPTEWHPYDPNQHPYFYIEPLECRTKEAHYCGLATCDSMICLNQFTPEQVWQRISADLI